MGMESVEYRADNAQKRIGNHDILGGEQHPLGHAGLGILIVRAHRPGTQAQGYALAHFTNELY